MDVFAQPLAKDAVPFVGAQVFIEPGQTSSQIDGWFKTMAENGMTMCRIRMFESYMKQSDGHWDFSLFDMAFQSAARYGIKVYATLFPATAKQTLVVGSFRLMMVKRMLLHYLLRHWSHTIRSIQLWLVGLLLMSRELTVIIPILIL